MTISSYVKEKRYLWSLLAQTRHALYKTREKELRQYGIQPRQAAVLITIKAIGDEATPAEISRFLLREPHSISRILQRMERDGLVNKSKDLHRKNLIRVTLTEKGLQAYNEAVARKTQLEILSCLSVKELDQLDSCLRKLLDEALKRIGTKHKLVFPP